MALTEEQPFVGFRHLPTRNMMPDSPTRGVVYFISDEGVLLVNHGSYVAEYGSGQKHPYFLFSTGEDECVQTEIFSLSEAVFSLLSSVMKNYDDIKALRAENNARLDKLESLLKWKLDEQDND